MEKSEIIQLEKSGSVMLSVDGQEALITTDDVEILSEDIPGWLVGNEGRLTVALDITLSDVLQKEGVARELVNRIQNLRKAKNFDITDRITIKLSSSPAFDAAITDNSGYIKNQVLADEIIIVNEQQENVIEIDDQSLTISINKNN